MRIVSLCIFLLCVVGCSGDDNPKACTDIFIYGLQVTVVDAASGESIKEGITVVAEDGDYGEALEIFTDVYLGAGEREGSYTLTVSGDNYVSEVVGPIEVALTEDECHVVPQQVTVTLQAI